MAKTHVILDGLSDPYIAQQLSGTWARAGYLNTVDPAAQCATLWREGEVLDEEAIDGAAAIARLFGLELRDRAGTTFESANDLAKLRERMAYEYKSRFATAVVFGLPALLLHYLSPILVGADVGPRGLLYPWLIQLLLVGWLVLAAGWPLLWQAVLSLRGIRATGDLLNGLVIALAFVPSVIAWVGVMVGDDPWLDEAYFHAAVYAVMLATLQRWLAHRAAANMAGRATWMIRGVGRLLGGWMIAVIVAWCVGGWSWALAVGLLMPSLIGLGAINPWSPGPSMVLPVLAFAVALVFGGESMGLDVGVYRVEVAAGFQLIMVMTFGVGWMRKTKPSTI